MPRSRRRAVAQTSEEQFLDEIKALPTTSARIRALHVKGLPNAEIVRYLNAHFRDPDRPHDFRYQHVYNVLSRSLKGRTRSDSRGKPEEARKGGLPERLDLQVGTAGRIVIPSAFRAAMGINEGDRLLGRVVDGELRLISPGMAIKRAQDLLRKLVPDGDGLIDETAEKPRKTTRNAEKRATRP